MVLRLLIVQNKHLITRYKILKQEQMVNSFGRENKEKQIEDMVRTNDHVWEGELTSWGSRVTVLWKTCDHPSEDV